MKLVIFGLSVSSSWGNGHATLWRGLCAALGKKGHRVVFFEKDVPYYASQRDLWNLPGGGDLILYSDWSDVRHKAEAHLADADVGMVTSYCPDALAASNLVLNSRASLRVFYDLDSPVTLSRLRAGQTVEYIGPGGLRDFDLVLSYAGGSVLDMLRQELGAQRVAPLYGSVDPDVHRPVAPEERYRGDLSYLGTYGADRKAVLNELLVEPARRRPRQRFVIGGSMYDGSFPWEPNMFFVSHVPVSAHPAFYCSSRLTLNATRSAMAETGYCPSGRLFEAAACATAILSDYWPGLEQFFEPGREIIIAKNTAEAVAAIDLPPEELGRIARAARERALDQHTADVRAEEMENIFAASPRMGIETVGAD